MTKIYSFVMHCFNSLVRWNLFFFLLVMLSDVSVRRSCQLINKVPLFALIGPVRSTMLVGRLNGSMCGLRSTYLVLCVYMRHQQPGNHRCMNLPSGCLYWVQPLVGLIIQRISVLHRARTRHHFNILGTVANNTSRPTVQAK